jgi:hypothetical protein
MDYLVQRKKIDSMTIKTQAYLQGYLHEKTADARVVSNRKNQNIAWESYYWGRTLARWKRERIRRREARGREPVSPQAQRQLNFLKRFSKGDPAATSWNPRSKTLEQWAEETPQYHRGGVLDDSPIADDTGLRVEDYA